MAQKSIEEEYQQLSQVEHILKRPDSYVGSIELQDTNLWVLKKNDMKFEYRTVKFSPGLYKIFDEILVNAADNFQRPDSKMTVLKVTINQEQNLISVWNNGKGIPVEIHKKQQCYVPEMVFGHLLTGSNYDDNEKKITGGRNGYGAKLTNIFSTKFHIETGDKFRSKKFEMTWNNNMSIRSKEKITSYSGSDFTSVTFYPDLKKFQMETLDDDITALIKKRVIDMCGIFGKKLKVYLNDVLIDIQSFTQYVDLYHENDQQLKIYDPQMKTERWDVLVCFTDSGIFQQVSFVNSICTSKGGSHVNYVTDQIVKEIIETIQKKHKKLDLKQNIIKQHLWIFLNSSIENPTFDSQTKENLTSKVSSFGSKFELSKKFIKDILSSGIVDTIIETTIAKANSSLNRALNANSRGKLSIPKLEDANDAGTKHSSSCTLILTEGDSAKTMAMNGINKIGRDKFGCFPLRGKLLNVREANNKQIAENKEIEFIMKILGLKLGHVYENVQSLRYGRLMIMTDQDHDGSHIKALLINFIHHFWPSLIQNNQLLYQFVTPIIKINKGKESKQFFTITDFRQYSQTNSLKGWKVKYYKGLGTSDDKEAVEYFQNIDSHRIKFEYINEDDDNHIDLLFNKKRADDRKEWLKTYDPEICVDHNIKTLNYKDFVNKEMVHYSNADNLRSIPSLCDGMKPGQRKILFACFKRNLINEVKVAQLSGYVSEHAAYHHGEISLQMTIIGMAQNFCGSNNISVLIPKGQFGSRDTGGKDHASSRYVHTYLSKLTRLIYPEPDDHLLKYLDDDGKIVEPQWYIPIIPMVLVNGADGIGTGWSTNIPQYNPIELINALKSKIQGENYPKLCPWYKGFRGIIQEHDSKGYSCDGILKRSEADQNIVIIEELPIKKWTQPYKEFLQNMENDKNENIIEQIKDYNGNNKVRFWIELSENGQQLSDDELFKKFKLSGTIATSNMVLFDRNLCLKKYQNVEEILDEFYQIRLEYYDKRKNYLNSKLLRELEMIDNKKRFILDVINDNIRVRNIKKSVICAQLLEKGYTQNKNFSEIQSTKLQANKLNQLIEGPQNENQSDNEENNQEDDLEEDLSKEYDYLLKLPIWSLTYEKIEDLKKQQEQKLLEYQRNQQQKLSSMWLEDLEKLEEAILKEFQIEEDNREDYQITIDKNGKKKQRKKVDKKNNDKKDNVDNIKKQKQQLNDESSDDDPKIPKKNQKKQQDDEDYDDLKKPKKNQIKKVNKDDEHKPKINKQLDKQQSNDNYQNEKQNKLKEATTSTVIKMQVEQPLPKKIEQVGLIERINAKYNNNNENKSIQAYLSQTSSTYAVENITKTIQSLQDENINIFDKNQDSPQQFGLKRQKPPQDNIYHFNDDQRPKRVKMYKKIVISDDEDDISNDNYNEDSEDYD